uniref:Uncharacterized protein n=1 Tax=viral metagenome TaxID=1070528 RepID=A0A6C0H2A9_9ZZZZ
MDKYRNIINEVSEEYKNKGIQDIIFQPGNNDLFWIYRQILEEDLKPGNIIKIRFDWCKEDKFKVVHINVEKGQEELFKNIDAGKDYINKESILFVKDDSLEEFIKLFDKSFNFKSDNSRNNNNTAENSVLDIHLIVDNDNNLHVVRYEILRYNLSSQNKDCNNNGFLVYDNNEAVERARKESVERANAAEAEANAKGVETNDEPDSDSESISGESFGMPLDKKMDTRQDESEKDVEKIAENALKNKAYKKEEVPAIINKIDETIVKLKEFNVRNNNDANQFKVFNKRYDEMIDFIDNYLSDDALYANDIDIHKFKSMNQNNYYKFKNEWENIKSKLKKQHTLLTVNTSDYWFKFRDKVSGFIELLKALRNDIYVNLFGGRTIRGGRKTKRRSRKIFSKNKRTKRHRKTTNL